MYRPYRRTTHVCMRLSREKPCIYSKTLPGQGLSQETQMQSKNRLSRNQCDKETQANREQVKEKKTLQTPNKRSIPSICYEENLSMAWGKPQQTK
jgi:hypothetical protein